MNIDEMKSFEIVGSTFNSSVTTQYSVIADSPAEAKRVFRKRNPNFDIKIVYPSEFDKQNQYSD